LEGDDGDREDDAELHGGRAAHEDLLKRMLILFDAHSLRPGMRSSQERTFVLDCGACHVSPKIT
jgi:hypothetical protein